MHKLWQIGIPAGSVRSGEQKAIQIICEQGSWTLTKRSHWAFWRKKIKFNGTFQVA